MTEFARRDLEAFTKSLADYLPGDPLFASKGVAGSTLRRLLQGLSGELYRCNGYLRGYASEILPDQTTKYLGEWERALGIPDSCFDGQGTVEERRRDVLAKLASLGVQTVDDFVELAAFFGATVTIENGSARGIFPMAFPIILFDTAKQARFTIYVTFTAPLASRFPLTFPFTFGDDAIAIMECLFNKLRPANVKVIFAQEGAPDVNPNNYAFEDETNYSFEDDTNYEFN